MNKFDFIYAIIQSACSLCYIPHYNDKGVARFNETVFYTYVYVHNNAVMSIVLLLDDLFTGCWFDVNIDK